ncbi:MAG: NADH-quinone oxidoreductase subunit NuoE, partial [Streptomyces sp.]|nr:NADH-quinone oxidoreductase subunit NuoE [Streptomyces sp.]
GFPDERQGAVDASGGAGPASLVGLRLSKGETPTARVVHPRDGGPHDEPRDAVQDTPPADPDHPSSDRTSDSAGPVDEEGQ